MCWPKTLILSFSRPSGLGCMVIPTPMSKWFSPISRSYSLNSPRFLFPLSTLPCSRNTPGFDMEHWYRHRHTPIRLIVQSTQYTCQITCDWEAPSSSTLLPFSPWSLILFPSLSLLSFSISCCFLYRDVVIAVRIMSGRRNEFSLHISSWLSFQFYSSF